MEQKTAIAITVPRLRICRMLWVTVLLLLPLLIAVGILTTRVPNAHSSSVGMGDVVANDGLPCRNGSVAISVATPVLNAFTQIVVIPAVEDESNTVVIPEQEEDHIWVDMMILQHFKMDSLTVQTAVPDAQGVTVSVEGFGLDVHATRFRYTYLGIRCYGHFTATMVDTDIDAAIGFTLLPAHYWNATVSQLQFKWGNLTIQHALDSKACGIAQSIIELFTGRMDKYIAKKVQEQLNADGKDRAAKTLNDLFEGLSVRALSPPIMTPERLSVVLDLTPESLGCAPQPSTTTLPPMPQRDIAVHTTAHDINNALYNFATHDKIKWTYFLPETMNTSLFSDILPKVYEMCPECPMYVRSQTSTEPTVVLLPVNTVTMTWQDLVVGLYVVPRTYAEWQAIKALKCDAPSRRKTEFERLSHKLADTEFDTDIPVLALSCAATFGVHNLTQETDRAIRFTVQKVNDFMVDVVESIIDDVNTVEIEQKGMEVWNTYIAPLLNSRSPYRIPFFLRKPFVDMTLKNIDGGVNIGVMKDFAAAVLRL